MAADDALLTDQRRALGSFLSSRRARLKPSDFDLLEGRRRTPGLRREEVALLAAVSVSWYTWLEQGRDIRPSSATLLRLSKVLQLNEAETSHLFVLASQLAPARSGQAEVSSGLAALLEALQPVPAYIRNSRLDILAWNAAAAEMFVDYGALDPHERNSLRLLFLYAPYRSLIVGWDETARGTLETFRASRARANDKSSFDELVHELCGKSEEFREWWPSLDVREFAEGDKRLRHPKFGLVELSYVALIPEGRPELSLVAYLPKPVAPA